MRFTGMARMVGDDLNTDQMYPTKYVNTSDPFEMAKHCMENYDPDFIRRIQRGDVIVAGKNFGCGSSREHAPRSILAAGISCVVAESFSRIFYRNALNIGLPIISCRGLHAETQEGDRILVDLDQGYIENQRSGKRYPVKPFPEFLQNMIEKGGLMAYVSSERREQ